MAVLQYKSDIPGLVGVYPQIVYIETNDTLAAVSVAGYLNNTLALATQLVRAGQMALVRTKESNGEINDDFYQIYVNPITQVISLVPNQIGNVYYVDVVMTAGALAAAGHVVIQAAAGNQQFKVRDIKINYGAAGLAGGGGDRLVQVTDGTTVYNNAGITAALLQTPVNTVWGGAGNPLPGAVAMNTSTVAGASLYAVYAGGTTDYTTAASSVTISVGLQRVA